MTEIHLLEISRHGVDDNISMDTKKIGWGCME